MDVLLQRKWRYAMAQKTLLLTLLILLGSTVGSSQDFWEEIGNPNKGAVWSIALDAQGRIFAATDSGIHLSPDGGTTWMRLNVQTVGRQNTGFLGVGPSGEIFASDDGGAGLWHSSDHGQSWTHCALDILGGTDILFHPSGSIVVKAGNGIYRSPDGGTEWEQVSTVPGVRLEVEPDGNIFALADSCYRSSDRGDTWEVIGFFEDLFAHDTGIYDFIITSKGQFVATTYCLTSDLYTSEDGGVTWVGHRMYGDDHSPVLASNSLGHVFRAGDRQVIRSIDGCKTWSDFTRGLTDTCATAFAVSESGYIYAGTKKGRVFRSVMTTEVGDALGEVPASFALSQNYPNPFNPSTTISYQLPVVSDVKLVVYDVLGREVATLVNGVEEPGSKSVVWNATGVASGVYFYRLWAGDFVQTRKLLLLK